MNWAPVAGSKRTRFGRHHETSLEPERLETGHSRAFAVFTRTSAALAGPCVRADQTKAGASLCILGEPRRARRSGGPQTPAGLCPGPLLPSTDRL